jgi:hypothetical protein
MRKIATGALLWLCGCTQSDLTGTYKNEANANLVLTKSHKLLLVNSGDTADYAIQGGSITVTSPIFGKATGKVHENQLVFPPVKDPVEEIVADALQGTWTKQ